MTKTYTAYVDYDEATGDYVVPLPEDMCAELGWKTDDTLNWEVKDGAIYLSKKEPKKYFLVECVSTFRMRYVVETKEAEWAGDTVVMQEAKEFSQKHIGEDIVSIREVTEQEIVDICDVDNDYVKAWTKEQKFKSFVTEEGYKPGE